MIVTTKYLVKLFKKIAEKSDVGFSRQVGNRHLVFEDGEFKLKKKENLAEKLEEDDPVINRGNRELSYPSAGRESRLKEFRYRGYRGESDSKIADRATDNYHIMSDILDNPSLVGADSDMEAVAKIASENPAWAKISKLTDAYDIDVETGTSSGESAESGETGSNDAAAEAASEAASSDAGDISTADPGDLGPSTPADYGMDTGVDAGSSGSSSSTAGGDIGGSTAGDSIGGSNAGGSIGSSTGTGSGGSGGGGGDT